MRARRKSDRRIRLLLVLLLAVFGVSLARATWLQTVRAANLSELASSQQHETVTIPAGRGAIVDRMGVQLAIGEEAVTVYANPRQVTSPRAVALAAAKTLGVDADALYPQLLDKSKGFVYVMRKADAERAKALQRRGLAGIGFLREEQRVYPQGGVAAHVLGYAGTDNRGLAGLELQLERTLAGRSGRETFVKDPFGRVLNVVESIPERPGRDVFLTIDHAIQANAESVLRSTVSQWGATRATAVVLDPQTGGVLAMAVAPGFDANEYASTAADRHRNVAVTDTYEPGSTFKLVTVAAALSEGLVSASTPFTLPYGIQVADRVVHDAEPRGTETMTVAEILSRSSNVGAITLAQLLGPERLGRWIERFGFGERTGVDFPGESPGIVLPVERWSGSTIGNVPIGQGIAVTAVQMAAAYAAIANGGVWTAPHLVDHLSGRSSAKPQRRRVLSAPIAAQVLRMLENVVSEGTGTLAAVPGYSIAGKTGTAAKPDETGGYSTSDYVASFIGIVPASRPRFVILVSVDEPRGAIWGGVVAAPAFKRIADFVLQYLEVPPDDPSSLATSE
ncbi:MAG TPA: penicillin-binding protein 2 [Gaiellaceae bacterium]|nr:penicillin-binding protein 2 [Gaiellaceae bacterium]